MRSAGFHQANLIAENLNIVREEVLTEVHNVQNVVADAMAYIPHLEEFIQPPPQNQSANAVIATPDMTQLISLREYRHILLVQKMHVYTYHKTILHENKYSGRAQCWWILLEDLWPTLDYVVKGKDDEVANALIRPPTIPTKLVEVREDSMHKKNDKMATTNITST